MNEPAERSVRGAPAAGAAARDAGRPVLAGLRVLEVSAFVAAPLAGLTLAQLGAEVIRVDPPGGNIDIGRLPRAPSGRSLYWASLNRGKRSAEIDFRKPEGKALVRRLLERSGPGGGILVTNLPLDGELGYEALSAARPDLIMVQLGGSPDGRSAVDYTVNSAVGFPMVTGDGRGEPVNHVMPAWDAVAGLTIATAVLAAERHRRDTGRGQKVSLNLSDIAMAMVSNLGYIAELEINGTERKADGNFLYGAYGDAFRTSDGRRVMVVAISERQWRALLQAVGVESALAAAAQALGHRLDDEAGRYAARDLVSAFLRPWFAARTLAQVQAAFESTSVLWGPYRSFAQMLAEDPRCSEANPMFGRVEHAGIGTFLTAATPMSFGATPRVPPAAAPRLGQDTTQVLREIAGLDDAELGRLAGAGVLGARGDSAA